MRTIDILPPRSDAACEVQGFFLVISRFLLGKPIATLLVSRLHPPRQPEHRRGGTMA
jgi:hypothetical protein